MAEYFSSTQHASWQLSTEKQVELRSSLLPPSDENSSILVEEELILQHYCSILLATCGPSATSKFNRSWRPMATSMVYFRRFYLYRSLAKYDPRLILLACLYLAGKVENEFIDGTDMIAKVHPKASIEELFSAEQELLIALDFQLRVHHPHNCIHAYLADIRLLTKEIKAEPSSPREEPKTSSKDLLTLWMKQAETAANHLCLSPAIMSYPPALAAIACILYTEPQASPMTVKDFLIHKFGEHAATSIHCDAQPVVQYIQQAEQETPQEEAKAALKRLNKRAIWKSDTKKNSAANVSVKMEVT